MRNRGFTIGIADRSSDESANLLKTVSSTSPRVDRFVHEVRWSMGDVIIWDNRFLSHTSGPQQRARGGDDDVPHHLAG